MSKMEWQPIETAPKDGTVIDLWMDSGRRQTEAHWASVPDEDGDYDSGWVNWLKQFVRGEDERATHWMPLPEPPASP